MKTIKAICLNPVKREVCYTKLPKRIDHLFENLTLKGWDVRKMRMNVSGDFDTIINKEHYNCIAGETFSLYGETYSGITYITNFNLERTELAKTKTTTKRIKENISW